VDVKVGIAIPLEVTDLVNSDDGATVGARLSGDDELFTNSPVITSIGLVEVGPPIRADRKYTMVLFWEQVGKFTPDSHSATSLDWSPRRNSTRV
jgi:hypothetical protein